MVTWIRLLAASTKGSGSIELFVGMLASALGAIKDPVCMLIYPRCGGAISGCDGLVHPSVGVSPKL